MGATTRRSCQANHMDRHFARGNSGNDTTSCPPCNAEAMNDINVKSLAENDLMVLCKAYCDTDPQMQRFSSLLRH